MSQVQAEHGFRALRFPVRLLGVARERSELDGLIAARVEGMLQAGLVAEVRSLVQLGFAQARVMASVGYRQVYEALQHGKANDERSLAESIIRATRVFARRQRTWLRDQPVEWLPAGSTKLA